MSYLLDTNIVSEVRKGARCDPHVSAWYASIADEDLFLSTLVLGEIRKGVERARARDPDKAAALERWLEQVIPEALDSDSFPNPVMARECEGFAGHDIEMVNIRGFWYYSSLRQSRAGHRQCCCRPMGSHECHQADSGHRRPAGRHRGDQ